MVYFGSPLFRSDSLISNMICTAMNKQHMTETKNKRPSVELNICTNISFMPSKPTQNPIKFAVIIIKILPTAPNPHTNR